MSRNLILTGGHTHTFPVASNALAKLLSEHAMEATIDDDIERGLHTLESLRPDLLTVYALRWSMEGSEKYAPYRSRWAFSLSVKGRHAIERHLHRGGGLLALHTAIICFDDWPAWGEILGGSWVWGRSSHPPYGPIEALPVDDAHPVVQGLRGFAMEDEVYCNLDLRGDVRPLMNARAVIGDWHPVLWTRRAGLGRVVVDTLGHDAGAFTHPVHRRIVARAALWAAGRDGDTLTPA